MNNMMKKGHTEAIVEGTLLVDDDPPAERPCFTAALMEDVPPSNTLGDDVPVATLVKKKKKKIANTRATNRVNDPHRSSSGHSERFNPRTDNNKREEKKALLTMRWAFQCCCWFQGGKGTRS